MPIRGSSGPSEVTYGRVPNQEMSSDAALPSQMGEAVVVGPTETIGHHDRRLRRGGGHPRGHQQLTHDRARGGISRADRSGGLYRIGGITGTRRPRRQGDRCRRWRSEGPQGTVFRGQPPRGRGGRLYGAGRNSASRKGAGGKVTDGHDYGGLGSPPGQRSRSGHLAGDFPGEGCSLASRWLVGNRRARFRATAQATLEAGR